MVGLDADAGYRATASVLLVAVVGAAQTQATDVSTHRYLYSSLVGTMTGHRAAASMGGRGRSHRDQQLQMSV